MSQRDPIVMVEIVVVDRVEIVVAVIVVVVVGVVAPRVHPSRPPF